MIAYIVDLTSNGYVSRSCKAPVLILVLFQLHLNGVLLFSSSAFPSPFYDSIICFCGTPNHGIELRGCLPCFALALNYCLVT